MIFVMHCRGIRRNDLTALRLAKRWSKVSAVLFAIGAVSGTVLSFEMGLLWPGLMGRFGDVLGLPFAVEGLSLFVEAIFLGIYHYGWDRMRPRLHLAMLLPMATAGIVGTFCVVSVNAWMNNPTGFTIRDGVVTDVEPLAAMFNDLSWLQFAHMYPILHDAPTLSRGLVGAALPLGVVAAAAGVTTLVLLYRRSLSVARITAAAAVGSVVAAWGVAQYPWLLVDQLTINEAAGAKTTLAALVVVIALAVVIVLPALAYLLRLTQTEKWSRA
jgi:cytochrome bd-type quinol oxidase subunit 2